MDILAGLPAGGEGSHENLISVAERVRAACIEAAVQGYERAGVSGLCHEGAWEAAIDAVRGLDLEALLRQ